MATVAPFRVVAKPLSALTAGVLSAMTIHRGKDTAEVPLNVGMRYCEYGPMW